MRIGLLLVGVIAFCGAVVSFANLTRRVLADEATARSFEERPKSNSLSILWLWMRFTAATPARRVLWGTVQLVVGAAFVWLALR